MLPVGWGSSPHFLRVRREPRQPGLVPRCQRGGLPRRGGAGAAADLTLAPWAAAPRARHFRVGDTQRRSAPEDAPVVEVGFLVALGTFSSNIWAFGWKYVAQEEKGLESTLFIVIVVIIVVSFGGMA